MRAKKGFTLIELMIVVIIVAVLAALIVPLLLSRVEKARYSEGKAIASQIATSVRAYAVEADTISETPDLETDLGFKQFELNAKWFDQSGMSVSGVTLNSATGVMSYIITCKPNDTEKLSKGDVVLECENNVSTFTSPEGL